MDPSSELLRLTQARVDALVPLLNESFRSFKARRCAEFNAPLNAQELELLRLSNLGKVVRLEDFVCPTPILNPSSHRDVIACPTGMDCSSSIINYDWEQTEEETMEILSTPPLDCENCVNDYPVPSSDFQAEKPVFYWDNDCNPPMIKQCFIPLLGGKRGMQRKNTRYQKKRRIPRGVPSVRNRINGIRLQFETNDLLNNATLLNPFCFSYFNLSNPQLSFNGSATAVPFFTSNALQYRKYRVRGFRVVAKYQNSEAFGTVPFVCPLNYLPTNSAVTNAAYIKNILARKKILGGINGNNISTVAVSGTVSSLSGFASNDTEDAYVGLTDGTAAPTDNIYCVVGVDTNGAASVSGLVVSVTVTFWIDFIERQTPAN